MKYIQTFESFLNEGKSPDDNLMETAKPILDDLMTGYTFNIKFSKDNRLFYSFNNSFGDSTLDLYYHKGHPAGDYYVSFMSKLILKSTSLANPRAAYQTTSARAINKTKTINDRDYFDTLDEAIAYIKKHLAKIEKAKK